MELVVRGRRDVSPLFIKLGVTVALSFAGFVLVQLRSRARARPPSPLASRPRFSSGAESQAIGNSSVGLKDELRTPRSTLELRNFQPPPGKTVARDLSKNLSPRSEEKAKRLILEYANSGADEKSFSSMDFDSEYSYSSQASTGEPEDASLDVSSSTRQGNPKKMKFLSKLKKLVLGKDTGSHKPPAADRIPRTPTSGSSSGRRASVFTCSIDDMIGGDSYGSFSSSITGELNPANQSGRIDAGADERCQNDDASSQASSRPSFLIQRLDLEEAGKEKDGCCGREVGTPYRYEEMVSREDFEGGDIPEKAEIKKLAVALERARGMSKLNRRSASFSN